jgi:hypothetical protein
MSETRPVDQRSTAAFVPSVVPADGSGPLAPETPGTAGDSEEI